MSTITQGVDARTYLNGWLGALVQMYTADINAIPDEKWTESSGGCARCPGELTADTVALLNWTTEALKGNVVAAGEDYLNDQAKANCDTKAKGAGALAAAATDFQAALAGAEDGALNASVMAPWGMEAPLFMLAQIAVSHVWYHDGQLNLIQCQLGDDKVHWMG